jgi:hypothetical protein
VAVTLGAGGCLVGGQGGDPPVPLPAIEVDVVDTAGCGDGFTVGMLAGLLLSVDPVDAAWLGIACRSLVATGLGSDAGIENLGQVALPRDPPTEGGPACPVQQPNPTGQPPQPSRPARRRTPRRRSSSGPVTSRSSGGRFYWVRSRRQTLSHERGGTVFAGPLTALIG